MEVRALPDPPRGLGCAFEHGTSPGSSSGRAAASEAAYAGSNPALGTATFATAEVGDSIQVIPTVPAPARRGGGSGGLRVSLLARRPEEATRADVTRLMTRAGRDPAEMGLIPIRPTDRHGDRFSCRSSSVSRASEITPPRSLARSGPTGVGYRQSECHRCNSCLRHRAPSSERRRKEPSTTVSDHRNEACGT